MQGPIMYCTSKKHSSQLVMLFVVMIVCLLHKMGQHFKDNQNQYQSIGSTTSLDQLSIRQPHERRLNSIVNSITYPLKPLFPIQDVVKDLTDLFFSPIRISKFIQTNGKYALVGSNPFFNSSSLERRSFQDKQRSIQVIPSKLKLLHKEIFDNTNPFKLNLELVKEINKFKSNLKKQLKNNKLTNMDKTQQGLWSGMFQNNKVIIGHSIARSVLFRLLNGIPKKNLLTIKAQVLSNIDKKLGDKSNKDSDQVHRLRIDLKNTYISKQSPIIDYSFFQLVAHMPGFWRFSIHDDLRKETDISRLGDIKYDSQPEATSPTTLNALKFADRVYSHTKRTKNKN